MVPTHLAAGMSLSVVAGVLMLACSGGEVTTLKPPAVEPVLQVNGHTLAPFYSQWNPPDGDPDLGDITMFPAADIVRITLVDGADTFRTVDVWVYDQRPSETAPRLAEATCSNLDTSLAPEVSEDSLDMVSGLIRLSECVMDSKDTHLAVDVSALAQQCSVLYMVVPVIWWPEVEPEAIVYPDFRTASWVFSLPSVCDLGTAGTGPSR